MVGANEVYPCVLCHSKEHYRRGHVRFLMLQLNFKTVEEIAYNLIIIT